MWLELTCIDEYHNDVTMSVCVDKIEYVSLDDKWNPTQCTITMSCGNSLSVRHSYNSVMAMLKEIECSNAVHNILEG